MNWLAYPPHRNIRYIIVTLAYASYVLGFEYYYHRAGIGVASLAIFPVIAASWYFGIWGGIFIALLTSLSNTVLLMIDGLSLTILYENPGNVIGTFSLIIIAFVVGKLSAITRERKEAILKLEQYERDHEFHTEFLELLNQITAKALEADSFQSTLEILTENIAHLFSAEDAFLTLWDAIHEVPVPMIAYGSMKDIYPYIQFEPSDVTPTVSVMKAEHPIPIVDIDNSPYISPKIAAIFWDITRNAHLIAR